MTSNPAEESIIQYTGEADASSLQKELLNPEQLLGMYDLGFDQSKLDSLEKQTADIDNQINTHIQRTAEERTSLERELNGNGNPRLRRPVKNDRPIAELIDRMEKNKRLGTMGFGPDNTRIELTSKKYQLQREAFIEKDKRSDIEDLRAVSEELDIAGKLPEVKFKIDTQKTIVMQEAGTEFTGQLPKGYIEEKTQQISDRIPTEVWFHTTDHLNRMVQNGGISTQSWLQHHDEEYYRILLENSGARGSGKRDSELSSPFNKEDTDKIYFRNNSIEEYGGTIIAYAPENLLLDTGLYFLPEGQNGLDERVISDIVDSAGDILPQTGESNLQISFDTAQIAVPKQKYRETCRQFLLAGYSSEWITTHVFSYRGEGTMYRAGQQAAVEEIKKRFTNQRETQPTKTIYAIPNPEGKILPRVHQLKTIQTVQFV